MRAWPEAPKGNLILRSALLRASRRMGHVHLRILATWICPRLTISFAPLRKRAHATLKRGRGEDRVRAAPAVSCAFDALENAHTSIQVQRKHSGLPCAMALRLIRAPWRPCCATIARVMRKHHRQLDASIGASGPHDFAVRCMPSVHAHKARGGTAASTASRTNVS